MAKPPPRLGKVQLQIMQILVGARGSDRARDHRRAQPTAPVAHSTTQTLLRKLEDKGAVAHESRDRVFVFRPLSRQSEVSESAARDLLTRVFGGSVYGLVSHLLKHEHISDDEMRRLRELIDAESGTGGSPMTTLLPTALGLLLQSTALLVLGLLALRLARRRGPAVQSLVGRATLAGVALALLLAAPLAGHVQPPVARHAAGPTRAANSGAGTCPGASAALPERGR